MNPVLTGEAKALRQELVLGRAPVMVRDGGSLIRSFLPTCETSRLIGAGDGDLCL